MFVSRASKALLGQKSLLFGLNSSRTLASTKAIKMPYWRPRWANENQGHYYGMEWMRRVAMSDIEVMVSCFFVPIFLCMWYEERMISQKWVVSDYFKKFNDKYKDWRWRIQTQEDEAFHYPRPIRVSELTDPTNKWHRYKNVIGSMNATHDPTFDVESGFCSNWTYFQTCNFDKIEWPSQTYRRRNPDSKFDYQGSLQVN